MIISNHLSDVHSQAAFYQRPSSTSTFRLRVSSLLGLSEMQVPAGGRRVRLDPSLRLFNVPKALDLGITYS